MNEHDRRHLAQESLTEDVFSSNMHSVQMLSREVPQMPSFLEYEIPCRYYLDMLVFLPVNLETSFVYWEVTRTLLSHHHIGIEQLRIKVYELKGKEEQERSEFLVSTELGKYYLHFATAANYLQARMGYINEHGDFIVVLVSNAVRMPNALIEFTDDEEWMSIDKNTREIIRSSMHRSFSSGDLIHKGQ